MIIQLLISTVAFYVTAYLIPGFVVSGLATLIVVSIVWGILTLIIRPILILLTLPINFLTLGLFTFVINALLLMLMTKIVPGFSISGFGTALLAAIVLSLVNMFLSKLTP
ncbi:MAG: phage holin family protein [Candidatus Shapirobacteria bacterium]|jgi:putative membrane protein